MEITGNPAPAMLVSKLRLASLPEFGEFGPVTISSALAPLLRAMSAL